MQYSYVVNYNNANFFGEVDQKEGYDAFETVLKEFLSRHFIDEKRLPDFNVLFELKDGTITTNYKNIKDVVRVISGRYSSVMSTNFNHYSNPEYVLFEDNVDDKEGSVVTITLTPIGYRLQMGTLYNWMGMEMPAYFDKFTSKNLKRSSANGAKSFKGYKEIYKCLSKNEEKFRYVIKNANLQIEVDDNGGAYNEKDVSKYKDLCLSLISSINDEAKTEDEVDDDVYEDLEGEATHQEQVNEALARMAKLNLYKPVINDIDKRLWKSEGPGMLYYLPQGDDEVMEAIEKVKENEQYPYHVIKTQTSIGEMISVLTVSKNKEDWKYERVNKDGWLDCYVFNGDICDIGPIQVKSLNGGLMRVA